MLVTLLASLPRLNRLEISLATILYGYYVMELFQQASNQNTSGQIALLGNLTHLDIESGTYMNVQSVLYSRYGVIKRLIQLPSITHLTVCGWGIVISAPELNHKFTSGLVHLELRRSGVDYDTFKRLLRSCRSLKTLIYES